MVMWNRGKCYLQPSHVGEYGWVLGVPGVLPATAGISLSWGEVANSFSCLPPPPAQAMIKEVPFHIFKKTNKQNKSSSFYLLVSYLTKLGQRMFFRWLQQPQLEQ